MQVCCGHLWTKTLETWANTSIAQCVERFHERLLRLRWGCRRGHGWRRRFWCIPKPQRCSHASKTENNHECTIIHHPWVRARLAVDEASKFLSFRNLLRAVEAQLTISWNGKFAKGIPSGGDSGIIKNHGVREIDTVKLRLQTISEFHTCIHTIVNHDTLATVM